MIVAISGNWILGWALGVVVVLLVAVLVLAITRLAKDIERQARDITEALDGTRTNTDALFAVKRTNHAMDRITRNLRRVRTGGAQ